MKSLWPRFIFCTAVLLKWRVVTILAKKWEILLWKNLIPSVTYDFCLKLDYSCICREDRAGLFSVVSSYRTKGNQYKFKYKKFHLSIGKTPFTGRAIDHWQRRSGKVVVSLFLGMFKISRTPPWATCCICPCSEIGVRLQVPHLTQLFYGSIHL